MADNIPLNPGQGGAVLKTLQHADGEHTPTTALVYATTVAPGANAVQAVDQSHGLPVEVLGGVEVSQADEGELHATAHQGGSWVVGLASGAEVKLAAGSSVAVSGTVALAPGTTVDLGSGATIDLDPNAEIKLGAGDKLIGKASAGVDGSTVYDGANPLKPKFAKISASSQSDNVVVPRVPGKRIRVLRWGLTAHGDVSATWKSDDDAISGARPLTKYASAGGAYCPVGCFETETGDALVLALSAPVQVGGELTYVEVSD